METSTTVARTADALQLVGAFFYFDPATVAHGKEHLGIDGFRFYILGRGGVLGNVPATVVHSAFGYFEPALIERMWDTARERSSLSPRDTAIAYLECGNRAARERFSSLDLGRFNEAAADVLAGVDTSGLPLFAGYTSIEPPTDEPALAFHHAVLLRELRGSVHLAAVTAAGLTSRVAHQLRRPNDVESFGYAEVLELSTADEAALAVADATTDAVMARHIDRLDDDARRALVEGAEAMVGALS